MKNIILVSTFIFLSFQSMAQDFGLSFSYFFPKNGDFSVPVTPFSIRGLGVDFNSFSGIETGASFYRMSGMNMKDIPFESEEALVGPFYSIMMPLQLILFAGSDRAELRLKGGVFGFFHFDTKLNEGNIDRALKDELQWEVLNSDFDVDNSFGYGYIFGGEVIFYVTPKFGINVEAQYLIGESKLNMQGEYVGLPGENDQLQTVEVSYPDSKLDYTGIEISLGAIITP